MPSLGKMLVVRSIHPGIWGHLVFRLTQLEPTKITKTRRLERQGGFDDDYGPPLSDFCNSFWAACQEQTHFLQKSDKVAGKYPWKNEGIAGWIWVPKLRLGYIILIHIVGTLRGYLQHLQIVAGFIPTFMDSRSSGVYWGIRYVAADSLFTQAWMCENHKFSTIQLDLMLL